MKKDNTRQYWQYISNDSDQLFEDFYRDYFSRFYNFGRKFTKEMHLVEDSIQEVFIEIWNKKDKIPQIALPTAYFFAAFRNILLQKIRIHARNAGDQPLESEESFLIDEGLLREESDQRLQAQLAAAMYKLTSRQRQVIFLRFYQGLAYEEVALIMNITVKATYKIAARSLLALKGTVKLGHLLVLLVGCA